MLKSYRVFFRFLLAYRWQFILFVIFLLCLGIAQSIQPYFYKLFVDAIPLGNYQQIFYILLAYIGVRLLELIFDLAAYWFGDAVLLPASRDARVTVLTKIHDLDFMFHLSRSTGSLISAIKRGDGVFFSLFHELISISKIIINFVVILFFFSQINWQIAALMFTSFAINLLFARWLIANNIQKRTEFNKSEDDISGIIVDNLINFETVKLFAKERWEHQRLMESFKPWMNRLWAYANSFRLIDIIIAISGNLGLFLIILFSIQQLINGQSSPGEFILVLGFISTFYPKFFDLISRLRNLAKYHTDLESYFNILDHHTVIQDPATPHHFSSIKGEIEFRNVTFTYPENQKPSLKNFNLKIRPGQSVALVGASGVGKTTIVKLLLRFYDVDEGEILIDGINIKQLTKTQLRSCTGVVPQEPILFNNTIGFNIGYGSEKFNKTEIDAAAKMANLENFINKLPKKFETHVGERGIKLSGGQKQRLAIARMILSNPDIIIFDEATSHLDSESEKLIQDAFWKAAHNKTTLIIAHRLATITRADQIVVIKNGRVAEIGSHRALLRKPTGLYTRFWNLQTHSK